MNQTEANKILCAILVEHLENRDLSLNYGMQESGPGPIQKIKKAQASLVEELRRRSVRQCRKPRTPKTQESQIQTPSQASVA
jgi:hypothetical protein